MSALLLDMTGCLTVCLLAFRDADFRRCWHGFTREAFRDWLPYMYVSVPSFILMATEMWAWTLQDFLAGLISTTAMAANAVAPNILLLQFSIGSSIGVAATTVIGHSLGEERADQACRTVRLSLVLAVVCLTPTTILFMI